jgi:chromosome segregation ATPase
MNIDERLDRLTERHEALTMNLELASAEIQQLKGIAETTLDSIKRLERIAHSHENRITEIEEGHA